MEYVPTRRKVNGQLSGPSHKVELTRVYGQFVHQLVANGEVRDRLDAERDERVLMEARLTKTLEAKFEERLKLELAKFAQIAAGKAQGQVTDQTAAEAPKGE